MNNPYEKKYKIALIVAVWLAIISVGFGINYLVRHNTKEVVAETKTEYLEFCFMTPTEQMYPFAMALQKEDCPIGTQIYRVEIIGTTTKTVK